MDQLFNLSELTTQPIDDYMMEPPFINSCNDVALLRNIHAELKNDGYFPHLEELTLNRIQLLSPKTQQECIADQLKQWTHEISAIHINKANATPLLARDFREKGNAAYLATNYTEAIYFYSKSLKYEWNAVVALNRSLVYYESKDYEKSEKDASDAIARGEMVAEAYWRRGVARKGMGYVHGSTADLRKANDMGVRNVGILSLRLEEHL